MRLLSLRVGAVIGLAVVCVAFPVRAESTLATLLDPYFRIQTALTDDKTDGVKTDAVLIAAEAKSLGAAGEPIAAAATELAAVADLNAARLAFGKLSDAVIAYSESTKTDAGDGVTAMYCPMVKKSWLQKGTAVKNPYYGKAMQGCGEKKKKAA